MEAMARFSRLQLKQPRSVLVLRALLTEPQLAHRITFVADRDFLDNTLLISEHGSDSPGFELELGARQREEVSIVNGHLVREVRRTSWLRTDEPTEALRPLRRFKGRLYVTFCFATSPPAWYESVLEPHPALPPRIDPPNTTPDVLQHIVREQIDLALLAILIGAEIDDALARGDRSAFARHVPVYREIVNRCLWQF